jgi:hypothetical protein
VWFLALAPGVMTNDSINIWNQVVTGRWFDWHPPLYTAVQWVSYQVVGSPALAVLAQSLALAWAIARILRLAIAAGLPAVPVWVGGAVVCALPPVGAFSIHVWKDVPYSVGFLLVLGLFLQMGLARVGLAGAPRWPDLAVAGGGVTLLMVMRPNGVLVVLATAVAVVVLARRRLVVAGVWAAGIVAALAISSLLYPALGVEEPSSRQQAGLAPFDIGYLATQHPERLDDDQLALIEELAPLSRWRAEFSCYWVGAGNYALVPTDLDPAVRSGLQAAWRQELRESPLQIAQGHLCSAGAAWNPFPTADERRNFEYLYTGIIDNELGLGTDPVVPSLGRPAVDVLRETMSGEWQLWLWRAPTWIYLSVLVAVVACVRARSVWLVVALAPLVAQQLSVIAMTGPHARYMLPAWIGAVASLPVLLVAAVRVRPQAPQAAERSAGTSAERTRTTTES